MKASNLKSSLFRLLISLIAIGCVIYFLQGEFKDAFNILRHDVDWSWFFIAVFTYFFANFLLSLRQLLVFKTHGVHMSVWESLHLSFLGLFFNLFLPSAVGGDVAKAYYAYKHNGKKVESMSAVLQDRLIGFFAIIIMATIAIGYVHQEFSDSRIETLIYVFVGVMVFAILFFGSKRFATRFKFLHFLVPSQKMKDRIADLYHAMSGFKHHPGILLSASALSFAGQGIFIVLHYFLALSLNVEISIWLFFLIVPVVAIITMAPSVGGLGVREAGIIFLLKNFMPSERALALSILLDIIIYSVSLMSGIFYGLKGGLKPKVIHEMEDLEV